MRAIFVLLAFPVLVLATGPGSAAQLEPLPRTVTVPTKLNFDVLLNRTEKAIEESGMLLVCKASASQGAAARGIKIPGNAVLMVFSNDYAVRMLEASVAAGFEAPIRLYVTENADGSATLTYRKPSAVFASYGSAALDKMALELDAVFEKKRSRRMPSITKSALSLHYPAPRIARPPASPRSACTAIFRRRMTSSSPISRIGMPSFGVSGTRHSTGTKTTRKRNCERSSRILRFERRRQAIAVALSSTSAPSSRTFLIPGVEWPTPSSGNYCDVSSRYRRR